MSWTDQLPESFYEATGTDLVAHLPELVWDLEGINLRRFAGSTMTMCQKCLRRHILAQLVHGATMRELLLQAI